VNFLQVVNCFDIRILKQKWQELINTEINNPQELTAYNIITFSVQCRPELSELVACSIRTLRNLNKDSLKANFIQAQFLLINFMINERKN
jgi:hypothetical protein